MSKRMNKATKNAFNEQVATLRKQEEAAGLWCVCGHSSPTHEADLVCQFVPCDCLSFRPSNTTSNQSPAPRAGEEEREWVLSTPLTNHILGDDLRRGKLAASIYCIDIPESDNRTDFAAVVVFGDEQRARQIVTEHNQHATLVEQRDRLLRAAKFLLAMNATNYDREVMRSEGGFEGLRKAVDSVEQEGKS